jgi:hypothetical protein
MLDTFGNGIFLTPQNRPQAKLSPSEGLNRNRVNGGLIYDEYKNIVEQSLDTRFAAIPMDDSMPIIDHSDNHYMFLGYSFRHYGHFILETLPMLKYCLDPEFHMYNKIFLPYFLSANNIVGGMNPSCRSNLLNNIKSFMSLLDIDQNKIYYHTDNAILKSNFIVPPKVCHGKIKSSSNDSAHNMVINSLVSRLPNGLNPHKKIFLKRPPNRISKKISDSIALFCQTIGFEIVNMEKLSIFDQVKLIRQAKVLLGFSGSAMHNSMFLHNDSTTINLCDLRDSKAPKCYIPNQKLCNRISGCQEFFIDFKYEDNTTDPNSFNTQTANCIFEPKHEDSAINYLQQSIIDILNRI